MNKISINNLILPGFLISLRIGNELTSSLNIVYRCNNDEIDIPLTENLINHYIFINTPISLKYKNEHYEYIIHGSISKIDLCGLPYIRIKVLDYTKSINNRKFPRQDVHLPANLLVPGNNIYFCTVSNISLGGLSFIIDKDLTNEIECETNIVLDDKNSIYAKGIINKCSYRDSLYEFRMQFTYMNEDNSNILFSCLHSIEESYVALRDKYLCKI